MAAVVDEVLAEVRDRIRRKREAGVYGPEVDAALRLPLPGGRPLFVEELDDPLPALRDALDERVEYDPRSRKPLVGPFITVARRLVMGLVRWWIAATGERQERVDRLTFRALMDLRDRPNPGFDERLRHLEGEWSRFRRDLVAADLHSVYFQARFGGDEPVIRAQSERFLDLFRGRHRVLDLGSGRGTFLQLMRDHGVGAYGVDLDERMTSAARARGLEVVAGDAVEHLEGLEEGSVDGLYARHLAEHILPGELVTILRLCRRVLAPGAPVVFVTPNPRTLSVGAHTFWLDPGHLRPIPAELFRFYLEVEGFEDVELVTFEPTEGPKLVETGDDAMRANVRLLNEALFGDRDYAVIGRMPYLAGGPSSRGLGGPAPGAPLHPRGT
ncbi:MAG: methyltransferase domain-containing protein [Chloroflexi bacterium]|nr:methyltransferase domain-containing protein [Chloroflexota bacterium]